MSDIAAQDGVTFQQPAALFQDFSFRCRMQAIDIRSIDIRRFRRLFALAVAGVGIAYGWEPGMREHLAAGRLIELLPQHATQKPGLFLYFPKRAAMAPKLRAFITVARDIAKTS